METKPYVCTECGIVFDSIDFLNEHVQSHDADVRSCVNCFKTFPNSWQLDRHIEQNHGGESDTENNNKVITQKTLVRAICLI